MDRHLDNVVDDSSGWVHRVSRFVNWKWMVIAAPLVYLGHASFHSYRAVEVDRELALLNEQNVAVVNEVAAYVAGATRSGDASISAAEILFIYNEKVTSLFTEKREVKEERDYHLQVMWNPFH